MVSEAAILALGKIITNPSIKLDEEGIKRVFDTLKQLLHHSPSGSTDSQRISLVVIRTVSRKNYEVRFSIFAI
jgi:hypothetical protein